MKKQYRHKKTGFIFYSVESETPYYRCEEASIIMGLLPLLVEDTNDFELLNEEKPKEDNQYLFSTVFIKELEKTIEPHVKNLADKLIDAFREGRFPEFDKSLNPFPVKGDRILYQKENETLQSVYIISMVTSRTNEVHCREFLTGVFTYFPLRKLSYVETLSDGKKTFKIS